MKIRSGVDRPAEWGGDVVALDGLPPGVAGPQVGAQVVDGPEVQRADGPGDDAVAAAAGRGRAALQARLLAGSLAECRDEIPAFDGSFGELTDTLASAATASSGGLRAVLDQHLELRRRIAVGIAGISVG